MPNANVGAPPVRETIDSSPTPLAASVISTPVMGAPDRPRPLTYLAAVSAVAPVWADGALIAKYKCWLRIAAVISAMIATNDSVSMPP
jgi:hypothetical protein